MALESHDHRLRMSLLEVQARWVKYRDGQCEWEADAFSGGSVQPMEYSYCIAGLTEERIAGLKEELCEGSGMTGPCAASRKYDLSRGSRARFRRCCDLTTVQLTMLFGCGFVAMVILCLQLN
jgi:lysozyme inhibitor LprI